MLSHPDSPSADGPLEFSVVVPTHFRPAHLRACLSALASLDFPKDAYEIVVVDDGGSEESRRAVDEASRGRGIAATYLCLNRRGPAAARNAGASAARGRYLAFTDDDCRPEPGWLTAVAARLTQDETAIVGGLTINALPDLPCSTASQLLIDYLYEYYKVDVTGTRFFTTNNLAVNTGRFHDVGRFDESFPLAAGEDREFCERWQHRGGSLIYEQKAVVRHWHRLNFPRFLRQHFNYGRGADFLHRSRARLEGLEGSRRLPRLEPVRFYFALVMYPFRRVSPLRAAGLALLLALSQASYGAGYVYQRFVARQG